MALEFANFKKWLTTAFRVLVAACPATQLVEAAGRDEIEKHIAALKDPDSDVRLHAIHILGGYIRDRRALEALLAALRDDEEEYVRFWAAKGLVQFKDPRVVEALVAALKEDVSGYVRRVRRWLSGTSRMREPWNLS